MRFEVDGEARLDQYLRKIQRLSRSRVQRVIGQGTSKLTGRSPRLRSAW